MERTNEKGALKRFRELQKKIKNTSMHREMPTKRSGSAGMTKQLGGQNCGYKKDDCDPIRLYHRATASVQTSLS
jgi:hypothetical protein